MVGRAGTIGRSHEMIYRLRLSNGSKDEIRLPNPELDGRSGTLRF